MLLLHELYLIQNMIDQVSLDALKKGVKCIWQIYLVNGQLSGANTEALQFGFSVFKNAPLFQEASLIVEEPKIRATCNSCHQTFFVKEYKFICCHCSCQDIALINGRELYIDYYEGD